VLDSAQACVPGPRLLTFGRLVSVFCLVACRFACLLSSLVKHLATPSLIFFPPPFSHVLDPPLSDPPTG